jgi:hypothetical protein
MKAATSMRSSGLEWHSGQRTVARKAAFPEMDNIPRNLHCIQPVMEKGGVFLIDRELPQKAALGKTRLSNHGDCPVDHDASPR